MKKECYLIKGMTCASCSSAVERVTRKMDGVKESQVNLATNRMTIEYDEEKLKPEDIIAKVERAGFGAELEIPEEIKKEKEEEKEESFDLKEVLNLLKKGTSVSLTECSVKEGETSPPKRYNSGSMILAMENAGQLIENEELREQIKGSGIGTSATRAEILKKLFSIEYLNLNKKNQIITPTLKGELVYGIVFCSMPEMISPNLTASWEKGLTGVADGSISEGDYMKKLAAFVQQVVQRAKGGDYRAKLNSFYRSVQPHHAGENKKKRTTRKKKTTKA